MYDIVIPYDSCAHVGLYLHSLNACRGPSILHQACNRIQEQYILQILQPLTSRWRIFTLRSLLCPL